MGMGSAVAGWVGFGVAWGGLGEEPAERGSEARMRGFARVLYAPRRGIGVLGTSAQRLQDGAMVWLTRLALGMYRG